ncbi:hypothetical protein [Pediococcus acidilactici]|uniref:hypothetical protein n=1 Tax=Pediococcus acidilactici TaxID=1254 RepID=UPI00232C7E12|nr:hypothetical protein [Pediococcus acidilactici]MDB8860119.1 hypothetical protein [Pediococcus acidilactici]MDB8861116.1 hypothetical protein [Pediococcus acidilactici]MDB8863843.1 hypothetical protein [Pediococcus acidilactici]MDB8866007.1 hypothetical protein [Pediococcus acidilactici]
MLLLSSYGWWPLSHWSPEWVGSIGTIATIWFTIRFYNKDRRVRFLINQSSGVIEKENNRLINKAGITLSGFNDSTQPALFKYWGFYLEPKKCLRIKLWLLNKLISFNFLDRWRYLLVKHRDHIRPKKYYDIFKELFDDSFETIKEFERTKDVKIPYETLLLETVSLIRDDKYNRKRLNHNKRVIIRFVFQKHDAVWYESRLRVSSEMATDIKQQLNDNLKDR